MSILLRLYNNIFVRLYNEVFPVTSSVDWTADEVAEILNSLLDRTLSSEDWDYFMSVEMADPKLEKIRGRVEEMWVVNSPYMLPGSINPEDLNEKGVAEIKKLIASIKK